MSLLDRTDSERAVAALIETYRQGFLRLDQAQIASIWDARHEPLVYVAQEKKEPTYGWPAIQRYIAALPEHLEKVLAKQITDVQIDILGDTAIAFVISHASVKLKARAALHGYLSCEYGLAPHLGRVARYPFSRIRSLRAGRAGDVIGRLIIQILAGSIRVLWPRSSGAAPRS
jgi:hypothetical protein